MADSVSRFGYNVKNLKTKQKAKDFLKGNHTMAYPNQMTKAIIWKSLSSSPNEEKIYIRGYRITADFLSITMQADIRGETDTQRRQ